MTNFEFYCQSIEPYPLLTKEEENKLSKIIQKGKKQIDKDKAIQKLIEGNLRLVIRAALDYYNRFSNVRKYVDVMDLISEGNIVIMRAAKTFNSKKGKFSTFALSIMENHFKRIIDLCRFIRIPSGHFKYWKRVEELKKKRGKNLNSEHVASELGISLCLAQNILDGLKNNHIVMLDEMEEWQHLVSDNSSQYENIKGSNLKEYLFKKIKESLNEREQTILKTFMINSDTKLGDLATKLKISKERVRQIYFVSLKKLRRILVDEWEKETHVKPKEKEYLKRGSFYYNFDFSRYDEERNREEKAKEERAKKILDYFLSNK